MKRQLDIRWYSAWSGRCLQYVQGSLAQSNSSLVPPHTNHRHINHSRQIIKIFHLGAAALTWNYRHTRVGILV